MSVIEEAQDVHLREYVRVILKRRYAVISFFVLFFSLVVVGTFTATPKYMASTKLLIEKVEPYKLQEYRYSSTDPTFYETQYNLIRSAPVIEKVMDALGADPLFAAYFRAQADERPWYTSALHALRYAVNSFGSMMRGTPGLGGVEPLDPEEAWRKQVVESLMQNISVVPVRDTKLVNVRFMATNPVLASRVVNTVAKAYIEALLDIRVNSSQIALEWVNQKLNEERAKLETSEQALQEYMQQNDIVTLEDRITIIPQKLSELSTQLTVAETKRRELEALYSKLRNLRDLTIAETIPGVASDVTVAFLRSEVLRAEQNVTDLSKKYGARHPVMIEAVSELSVLRQKKNQEIRRVIDSIHNEFELALSNEQTLVARLNATKQEALSTNQKFIQYSVLKRDVEASRQLFDSLLRRMREQSLNEEVQTVSVVIIEEAEIPKTPASPRKLMNLLLGLIFGAFGSVGLAFFIDYFDNTLRSPEEIEQRLGVPVLGMINKLKHEDLEGEGHDFDHIVLQEPKSTCSENYKALRTAIMLSSAESTPKSLLVTSMGPEEGKTSTSVNLAFAIAQSGARVLLIDCDLRKPRVHQVFDLPNAHGVSTFLAGNKTRILQSSPLANMKIITAGPIPPNPSEMLGSRRFAEMLEAAAKEFDIVLLDSPPVMSVSDALVLSRLVDGAIVVARAGKTTYDMATKGIKHLRDVKAHIVGLLLNAVDFHKSEYYYYRYQGYYYYGYGNKLEDADTAVAKEE